MQDGFEMCVVFIDRHYLESVYKVRYLRYTCLATQSDRLDPKMVIPNAFGTQIFVASNPEASGSISNFLNQTLEFMDKSLPRAIAVDPGTASQHHGITASQSHYSLLITHYSLLNTIKMTSNFTETSCAQTKWWQAALRILLGVFMSYAGVSHLSFARVEFLAQVPPWVPLNADLVVVLSGIVEVTLGLSMIFLRKYKVLVGLALASFYVLIFPGNISQYVNHVDGFGLDTDQARLIRLFFQPVLVFWALGSTGALCYLLKRKK